MDHYTILQSEFWVCVQEIRLSPRDMRTFMLTIAIFQDKEGKISSKDKWMKMCVYIHIVRTNIIWT